MEKQPIDGEHALGKGIYKMMILNIRIEIMIIIIKITIIIIIICWRYKDLNEKASKITSSCYHKDHVLKTNGILLDLESIILLLLNA